ncbi:glycosyltransferase family 2 protein [Pseudorhodobacter turbinis]|nr:glycosyltransferase family 2 protein [Pseudorhodobacter turbinis]
MPLPKLGVVVVTFNAADVILDCLESLLASQGVALRIAVVDNASTDDTLDLIRAWASGTQPYSPPVDMPFGLTASSKPVTLHPAGHQAAGDSHSITLIETGINAGFAAGVNCGLAELALDSGIDRFWVLNPDSAVPADTALAFARHEGAFSLMGGRVLYYDAPDIIQIDGGTINKRTGVTGNIGLGCEATKTAHPNPADIDFITGASVVASRTFYETAGPMPEDYFLYYEEVDWALRRGDLPLAYCPQALVYHRAGTAIGSPTLGRPASPFSLYFKHRARLRFVRRHFTSSLPVALIYSAAKAIQIALKGYGREAWTIVLGSLNAAPPPHVRRILSKDAAEIAFRPPVKPSQEPE